MEKNVIIYTKLIKINQLLILSNFLFQRRILSMPRVARNQIETSFFHNMTQGINKEYIFEENRCKKKYMELLQKESNKFNINLIVFTIMDNHAHILLYTEDIKNMSLFMKSINEQFAMYYNYINERVGIVFRNRYKSQPILSERQLMNCIRYIFNNPVRANLVLNPEEYSYSNFQDFKEKEKSNNILDEIYQKINHSIQFPEVNDEKLIAEANFLDTSEDKKIFIKELIRNYEKQHDIIIAKDVEEIKKLVQYIRKKTNISYKILTDILNISKATITRYQKDDG